jgi:hypothetical protein
MYFTCPHRPASADRLVTRDQPPYPRRRIVGILVHVVRKLERGSAFHHVDVKDEIVLLAILDLLLVLPHSTGYVADLLSRAHVRSKERQATEEVVKSFKEAVASQELDKTQGGNAQRK